MSVQKLLSTGLGVVTGRGVGAEIGPSVGCLTGDSVGASTGDGVCAVMGRGVGTSTGDGVAPPGESVGLGRSSSAAGTVNSLISEPPNVPSLDANKTSPLLLSA